MSPAEFRLLGPVEVFSRDGAVALGGPRGQCIAAALLLEPNVVVSVDRLVAAAWGDTPPATARTQAQNRVSTLRRLLRPDDDGAGAITRHGSGYVIQVGDGQLDAQRFGRFTAEADALMARGCHSAASAALSSALRLWRGPALDGLHTPALAASAQRLEEERALALETSIELDLAAGRHGELLGQLTTLTHAHPYRERLRGFLMLAQYRAGRQEAALDTFRHTRALLVEQLGVEPGIELQRLHEAILGGDDDRAASCVLRREAFPVPVPVAVSTPPGLVVVPRQLPTDVPGFTGRNREVAALDALLESAGDGASAVAVGIVAGSAGVGKTSLAVHWAHRVADRFPDGHLYVDLRGYAQGPPMRPVEALGQFLRALGMPSAAVPVEVTEMAALYRSRLAGQRVLVVLDNAASVDQIRPLLPGSAGCLVLVTARNRLSGLVAREGAHRFPLDVLTAAEARTLLGRAIGTDRVQAEETAVDELARACAYLPLALRIAAANLTDEPGRSIATYVAELTAGNRLATLQVHGDAEAAVRAAFDLSYRAVPPAAQRLFRLLGLVPGADFTADAAAALAGIGRHDAQALLDRLAGAHLIHQVAPGRFTFHDLLRSYAAERAEQDGPDGRAATRRLIDWYVHGAYSAAILLYPDILRLPVDPPAPDGAGDRFGGDADRALAWLHAEQPNLLAACVAAAAEPGLRPLACALAGALRGYLGRHGHRLDYLAISRAGLDAAEAEDDIRAQALLSQSLAHVHNSVGEHHEAIVWLERSLALCERSAWADIESRAHDSLGIVYAETGYLHRGAEHFRKALDLCRRAGAPVYMGGRLTNLGTLYRYQGQLSLAAETLRAAVAVFHNAGAPNRAAETWDSLGAVHHELGQFAEAEDQITRCIEHSRAVGNHGAGTSGLVRLAALRRDAGRHSEAIALAEDAVRVARDFDFQIREMDALVVLGSTHYALGDHDAAIDHYRAALRPGPDTARFRSLDAVVGLANAEAARGHWSDALPHACRALEIATQSQSITLEATALTSVSRVQSGLGANGDATRNARRALRLHRQAGHRVGEARALVVLGNALAERSGPAAARPHWATALELMTEIGMRHEADGVRALLG